MIILKKIYYTPNNQKESFQAFKTANKMYMAMLKNKELIDLFYEERERG